MVQGRKIRGAQVYEGLSQALDENLGAASHQFEQAVFLIGNQVVELHGPAVNVYVYVPLRLADQAHHGINNKNVDVINRGNYRVVFELEDDSYLGIGKLYSGQMVGPAEACCGNRQHFKDTIEHTRIDVYRRMHWQRQCRACEFLSMLQIGC